MILHFFLENVFGLYFCHIFLLINLYPCNYLSRECGLYKASDLLLGDHVCEKSDAANWIDYHLFDYVRLRSIKSKTTNHKCIFNNSVVVQSNLFKCCS